LSNYNLKILYKPPDASPRLVLFKIYVNGVFNTSTVNPGFCNTRNLQGGKTYEITVVSVDEHGITSTPTDAVTATTSNIGRPR
jgi:hypothetical protein